MTSSKFFKLKQKVEQGKTTVTWNEVTVTLNETVYTWSEFTAKQKELLKFSK